MAQLEHLVDLPGATRWCLWKWAAVRSAGFPLSDLAALSAPALAVAGDQIDPSAPAPVAFAAAYESEATRAREAARALIGSPRYLEALTWQNRGVLTGSLGSFLRAAKANARDRKRELVAAAYLQRYAAKNDSIGFFGPWGWATLDAGARSRLQPGAALLAGRQVLYEYWALDLVARSLSADPALRRWLPPRRHPAICLGPDRRVRDRQGEWRAVPAAVMLLLRAMDGRRSGDELAAWAAALPEADLPDREAALRLLDQIVEQGWALWTLELPTHVEPPARCLDQVHHLRARLAGLGDPELRAGALATLDRLERDRAQVAAAAGDPTALDAAIGALETTFSDITRAAASRNAGKMYAARTIFFEDCVRDLSLVLGQPFLEALAAPLAAVLLSARWYTWQIGTRFQSLVRAVFEEVRGPAGRVPYLDFWRRLEVDLDHQGALVRIVDAVVAELTARWAEIVGPFTGSAPVTLPAEEVLRRAAATFSAPCPGWPTARFHSPDVMIAAPGPSALADGPFTLVLGELHAGWNTLAKPLTFQLHPSPEALVRALELDLPMSRVMRPEPWDSPFTVRAGNCSFSEQDFQLASGRTPSNRPPDRTLATGELAVEEIDGRVMITAPDRGLVFEPTLFFEEHLRRRSVARFKLLPDAPVRPRLSFGQVCVSRASWSFPGTALASWDEVHGPERFLAVRRWASRHGLPARVFARVAEERKPYYIDLESVPLVELLAKLVRGTSHLTMTEMLPGADQLWLVDAQGAAYTSELRLAAVDPEPWSPHRLR
jgi:hypothetical protein